jgi:glycosyltransferase involved in cell wall biosynthesis
VNWSRSLESPLISCLCVTEDRPAFVPWLWWNYEKQDHPACELIVVDSSREPVQLPVRDDVTVIRCPPRTTVGRKRNIAIEAARGVALIWFDDDDWQHPRKASLLASALEGDGVLAGIAHSWFVELSSGRCRRHEWARGVLFNGSAARREAVVNIGFDETLERAADTAWMISVNRRSHGTAAIVSETVFFWLCHDGNVSNPARRYVFPLSLDAVRQAVGPTAWGDTDEALSALRSRQREPALR